MVCARLFYTHIHCFSFRLNVIMVIGFLASTFMAVSTFQNFARVSSFLSTSSAVSSASTKRRSPTTMKLHRILCYGDSLTAGTSGYSLYPYAPYLEKAFNDRQDRQHEIVVRHRGLPGWTAAAMVEEVDGPSTGLRSAIRNAPGLSLVIILAGTNDMGYGHGETRIMDDILQLHKIALEEDVPKTIAISLPPSGYQSFNDEARKLADQINRSLKEACNGANSRTIFVPFPFEYERGGAYWDPDSLHFSELGYKTLGESLIATVESALTSIETEA